MLSSAAKRIGSSSAMSVQRTLRANHIHASRDDGCGLKRYRPRFTHKVSAKPTLMSEAPARSRLGRTSPTSRCLVSSAEPRKMSYKGAKQTYTRGEIGEACAPPPFHRG